MSQRNLSDFDPLQLLAEEYLDVDVDEDDDLPPSLLPEMSTSLEPMEALPQTTTHADSRLLTACSLTLVLRIMGMDIHFIEVVGKSKNKASTLINNFSSLLVFIASKCSLHFDATNPVATVDSWIELLLNKNFIFIPHFTKHLDLVRSLSPSSILSYCDSIKSSAMWFYVYYAPERARAGVSFQLVGFNTVMQTTRALYKKKLKHQISKGKTMKLLVENHRLPEGNSPREQLMKLQSIVEDCLPWARQVLQSSLTLLDRPTFNRYLGLLVASLYTHSPQVYILQFICPFASVIILQGPN